MQTFPTVYVAWALEHDHCVSSFCSSSSKNPDDAELDEALQNVVSAGSDLVVCDSF